MNITPIRLNNPGYYKPTFRSTTANEGILAVQSQDVTQFKRNMEHTANADMVQSNPFKAFLGKLKRTLNIVKQNYDDTNKMGEHELDQLITERRFYI